eukprot:4326073-Pyramimonas_sp.AAC.1
MAKVIWNSAHSASGMVPFTELMVTFFRNILLRSLRAIIKGESQGQGEGGVSVKCSEPRNRDDEVKNTEYQRRLQGVLYIVWTEETPLGHNPELLT